MNRHYFKELRLQQFRALVYTARHGSFSGAARALNLSRTSVWQQIRSLEGDFGAELLMVVDHQPQLTAEGKLLFKILEPLVHEFEVVKETFQTELHRVRPKVTIATTTSLLSYELCEPAAEFRRKFPEVSLSFVDRTSAAATELLAMDKADLAVTGHTSNLPDSHNFEIQHLLDYTFVLAREKKYPWPKGKIKIQDLVKHPLIIPSLGANARERIDRRIDEANLGGALQIAMQSYNTALMLAYAQQGLGVALLSLSPRLMALHKAGMCFQDVSHLFGVEEIIMVRRRTRFKRLARRYVDEFAEMVLKQCAGSRRKAKSSAEKNLNRPIEK